MRRVNSSKYTRQYYLTDCTGFQEFSQSYGKILEPRLKKIVSFLRIKPGLRVLDIGCGRGELVLWAAAQGAEAVGIDYSSEAIKLAKLARSKQAKKIQERTKFLHMDAKKLDFDNGAFDLILLTEVIEHLYPEELKLILSKISKILKSDGLLFIHSAPNRWFNNYIYPFYCYPVSSFLVFFWRLLTGKSYPNLSTPGKIRTPLHQVMHVNEPTYFYLKNLFRKNNFVGEIRSTNVTVLKPYLSWKDLVFNTLVYLYPLSNYFPLNIFWGNDFLAILKKARQ